MAVVLEKKEIEGLSPIVNRSSTPILSMGDLCINREGA